MQKYVKPIRYKNDEIYPTPPGGIVVYAHARIQFYRATLSINLLLDLPLISSNQLVEHSFQSMTGQISKSGAALPPHVFGLGALRGSEGRKCWWR